MPQRPHDENHPRNPTRGKLNFLRTQLIYPATTQKPGDGFSENELARALDSLQPCWDPKREYENFIIGKLVPGPKAVTFTGRIVNLSTRHGSSVTQPKAKGWHNLIIKDDTAAIAVKLYFTNKPFPLRLGQLLSFWTAFISDAPKDDIHSRSSIRIAANMFPGRVASDHFLPHHSSSTAGVYRLPLGYETGRQLAGFITLDCYLRSGHDGVIDAKLLVIVKSIGATKRIQCKGEEYNLAQVVLMDNTAEVGITLWNDVILSAREWRPAETVLLISSPGYRPPQNGSNYRKGDIEILRHTMIDIDPRLDDTEWLRRWAESKSRREAVAWEFGNENWDVQASNNKTGRILLTLAGLDDWWGSVKERSNISMLHQRNYHELEAPSTAQHRQTDVWPMVSLAQSVYLLSANYQPEVDPLQQLITTLSCGIPRYSNEFISSCLSCDKFISLKPNARLIGTLLDETGCIEGGSLLWSRQAWERIFGRAIEEIANFSFEDLAQLEQRLIFLRLHLHVGWKGLCTSVDGNIGRLCVLDVET